MTAIIENLRLNRPVRIPSDVEARLALAKDLSCGRWEKARRILHLPLIEVALLGQDGVATAERMSRSRARKAA